MELTLPEKIQLLRKRLGLNQGQFGAQAFDTSVETGRTKIKNIELGKQQPTSDELAQMAKVLEVSTSTLHSHPVNAPPSSWRGDKACLWTKWFLIGSSNWALTWRCSTGPCLSTMKNWSNTLPANCPGCCPSAAISRR